MASQEFLASFAVEIDEAGVSRLQQVLEENRTLAEEVAAAFEAATAAIREYQKAALGGNGDMNDFRRAFRHLPMCKGGEPVIIDD